MKHTILFSILLLQLTMRAGDTTGLALKNAYAPMAAFLEKNRDSVAIGNYDIQKYWTAFSWSNSSTFKEWIDSGNRDLLEYGSIRRPKADGLSSLGAMTFTYLYAVESRFTDILVGFDKPKLNEWLPLALNYKREYVELATRFRERAYPDFLIDSQKIKQNNAAYDIFNQSVESLNVFLQNNPYPQASIEKQGFDYILLMIDHIYRLYYFASAHKNDSDKDGLTAAIELAGALSRDIMLVSNVLERELLDAQPVNRDLLALVARLRQDAAAFNLHLTHMNIESHLFWPDRDDPMWLVKKYSGRDPSEPEKAQTPEVKGPSIEQPMGERKP